jgi:hypothetical protein
MAVPPGCRQLPWEAGIAEASANAGALALLAAASAAELDARASDIEDAIAQHGLMIDRARLYIAEHDPAAART